MDSVKAFLIAVVDEFLRRHGFAVPVNAEMTDVSPSKPPRGTPVHVPPSGEHQSPHTAKIRARDLSFDIEPETPRCKGPEANIALTIHKTSAGRGPTPIAVQRIIESEGPPQKRMRLTSPVDKTPLEARPSRKSFKWIEDLIAVSPPSSGRILKLTS